MSVSLIEVKMTCLHPLRCKSDKGEKSEGKRKEKKDETVNPYQEVKAKEKDEQRALDQSTTKCAKC